MKLFPLSSSPLLLSSSPLVVTVGIVVVFVFRGGAAASPASVAVAERLDPVLEQKRFHHLERFFLIRSAPCQRRRPRVPPRFGFRNVHE